jgi:hypothetical protein
MKLQLLVEITKVEVREKRATSRLGKPFLIREQAVWAKTGKEYPEAMRVRLEGDDPAYQPGKYMVTEDCLYINQYGQLTVGRVSLKKVDAQATRAA